jgi:hypothetical protein
MLSEMLRTHKVSHSDGKEAMVDQEHKAQSRISICSADGWNSLTFEFQPKLSIEEGGIVVATIRGEGKFWDRQQTMSTTAVGELVPDYELNFAQVILSEERLRQCRDFLENWLCNPFEFELQLSATNESLVTLFIGVREDFISKVDRPVFSLQYSSSRMKAESCFVIDRSCIDLFLQGLNVWITGKQ